VITAGLRIKVYSAYAQTSRSQVFPNDSLDNGCSAKVWKDWADSRWSGIQCGDRDNPGWL